jgi:hypothetical protein
MMSFGIFFPGFGMLLQEKSGNPDWNVFPETAHPK